MEPSDISAGLVTSARPHVIVFFGATGDLAARKLLPGLLHLFSAGLLPDCRIVGTSLDEHDDQSYRELARKACLDFARPGMVDAHWDDFASRLTYVGQDDGPDGLRDAVRRAEAELSVDEPSRLHYLAIPPAAALPAV